jgi:hypothetical protein
MSDERDIRTRGRVAEVTAMDDLALPDGRCSVMVKTWDAAGRLWFAGTVHGIRCDTVRVGDDWAVSHGPYAASAAPENDDE